MDLTEIKTSYYEMLITAVNDRLYLSSASNAQIFKIILIVKR